MTSNAGRFVDRSPQFISAGKVPNAKSKSTTKECLIQLIPPATPENIKKWRKSAQLQPGKTVLHPGQLDCPPPQGVRFGRVNDYTDSAQELLQSGKLSQFHNVVQEHLEANYLSSKREPLGVSMTRGHQLPSITERHDFAFGRKTNHSENAGTVIYPPALEDELKVREDHEKYVKTHGDYAPGEQKRRNYNWAANSIDPSLNRFGYVLPKGTEESPYLDPRYSTVIVRKCCDDFRLSKLDELGTTKNMGFGNRGLAPDHAFGTASQRKGEKASHVQDCIASGYDTQVMEDDVGHICTHSKLRKKQKKQELIVDPARSFGVPTVRTDISKPRVRKVTSNQNYGDDATCKTLLNPNQYSQGGVGEQEFMRAIGKAEMQGIAAKPQYGLRPELFEECWEKAMSYSPQGVVSLATFSRAVEALGY